MLDIIDTTTTISDNDDTNNNTISSYSMTQHNNTIQHDNINDTTVHYENVNHNATPSSSNNHKKQSILKSNTILNQTPLLPISEDSDTEWSEQFDTNQQQISKDDLIAEQQRQQQQQQLSLTESLRALYVDESNISKHLKCVICTLPYVKPITHSLCGNVFCAGCVLSFSSELCPCCRGPLKNKALLSANVPLRSMLDELRIRCPSCLAEMRRDALPAHTNSGHCSPSITCKQKCGTRILHTTAAQQEHNELYCNNTILSCDAKDIGCDYTGNRTDIKQHHDTCKLVSVKYTLTSLHDKLEQSHIVISKQNDTIKTLQDDLKSHKQQLKKANDTIAKHNNNSNSKSNSNNNSTATTPTYNDTLSMTRSFSHHNPTTTSITIQRNDNTIIQLQRSQSHSPPSQASVNNRHIRHNNNNRLALPGHNSNDRENVCAIM